MLVILSYLYSTAHFSLLIGCFFFVRMDCLLVSSPGLPFIRSNWKFLLVSPTWLPFNLSTWTAFKGTVPPAPEYPIRTISNLFRKFAEIFASQGTPPVSTTPVANFATSFASVVDTGGKFATGDNLRPVSKTPAANFPPVSMAPVANNGNNIRLLRNASIS